MTVSSASTRELTRREKLQHFLVLRAFNLRRAQETLQQQFRFLRRQSDANDSYLELDELCAYLSIPPFRRLLLLQVFGLTTHDTQLDFDAFLHFLQSAAVRAARQERQNQLKAQCRPSSELPSPPETTVKQSCETLVAFEPSRVHQAVTPAPPAPGLWKKREVTIQERITEYTKIDEQGRPQRLVEKERHQTEVLHMESLDGEFAHREITQFEQTEHLNDEMVHLDHGREEFLHLKSQHDEISRFESSVPSGAGAASGERDTSGRPEECEQQPPSPKIKRDPSSKTAADVPVEVDTEGQAEAEAAAYAEAAFRMRHQQETAGGDVSQES